MYFSNFLHFLNETGDIPKEMPKEGRQMAGFLVMAVDITTKGQAVKDDLRCFIKNCNGNVNTNLSKDRKVIEWKCTKCSAEGRISDWQGTKWDNMK